MRRLQIFSVVIGFAIWQLICTLQVVDPVYFPAPLAILNQALLLFAEQPEFRGHLVQSLSRLLAGLALALPLALFLSLLTTLKLNARAIVSPWIGLTYPIPKLALFPFLLIVFGTGDTAKIVMIGAGAFFLMYLSFEVGLRRVFESELFEVVRVYNVSRYKVFRHVLLKGAAPEIINGIKMGTGYGLVMMVGSEMTMSKNGLGFYLWNAWDQFHLLDMYACMLWISLLGITVFTACDRLERKAGRRMRPATD